MTRSEELVERYIAVWHETDESRRRTLVEDLWTPEGSHFSPTLEAQGYEDLMTRVLRSHNRWVRDEGCTFRRVGDVLGHHGAVTFQWEMVCAGGTEVISEGYDLLFVARDGRLRDVYQFVTK